MLVLTDSELLLYGGISLMVAAVLSGIVAAVIFSIAGKRLKTRLEREFGKKRH